MRGIAVFLLYIASLADLLAQSEMTVSSGTTSALQSAFTKLGGSGTVAINGKMAIDQDLDVPAGIELDISRAG
jgi:hypothetical protein